jgi:thioesterase domain-containing protein
LGRPDLTAERFIADASSPDARLYRTGDVGRWTVDGVLEYLGRNDDQLKVRGFRIEPGEIEAQLGSHDGVRAAAVVVREAAPGDKRLVGYVTLRDRHSVTPEELRSHLKARLPEHMIPSAIAIVDGLPLTPSGKLNRRALPAPDAGSYANRDYEPPQGRTEEALARIWGHLLQMERVGRQDNFFDLGGHSLLAIRVVSRIQQELGISMSLATLWSRPTISALAECLTGNGRAPRRSGRLTLAKSTNARHAVCFLPTALGLGTRYKAIAERVGVHADFYSCALPDPFQDKQPIDIIEELARHCVQQFIDSSDYDEWSLVGWSFGGVLAYESAIQMARMGLRIRDLVLIDTYLPSARLVQSLRNDKTALLEMFQKTLAGVPSNPPNGVFEMFKTNIAAMLNYEPAIYEGFATEIRAADGTNSSRQGDDAPRELPVAARWVTIVPGDHYSMMDERNIEAVTVALERALRMRDRDDIRSASGLYRAPIEYSATGSRNQ